MTMKRIIQLSVTFILFGAYMPVNADKVNQDWEQRTTEKLAGNLESTATDVVWLDTGGTDFLALYNEQSNGYAKGAIIILHAMGTHADWPQIISPIRTKLPNQGWSTLSIQLPLIAPENQIEDYGGTLAQSVGRIGAAIKFLRERQFTNIVVIGHSFGAALALAYLEKQKNQNIGALVAIGLQNYAFLKPAMDILALITKTKIPVLDIYGDRDFKNVIKRAPDRRLAAKKGNNERYTQLEIEGADHYFTGMEDILIQQILEWLDKAGSDLPFVVYEGHDINMGKYAK